MSQAGVLNLRSTPTIPLQFTCDSGVAVPALNNVNVYGGTGANTVGAGDTITINTNAFDWNVVTSATNPNSLVKNNGYIPKGAGVVTFVLPAAAAIGDMFAIAGYGNLWTLTQNANQSVTLGVKTTSVGVLGSVTATQVRDSIMLICVETNTEFQIINGIGNLTFV